MFGDNGNWAWGSSLIAAANACVSNGSTIISMSLGGPGYSFAEESAFESIYNDGVLVIAAAGNNGSTDYSYPAPYGSVISVGAVNSNKALASFSQRNNQVDLCAPGGKFVNHRFFLDNLASHCSFQLMVFHAFF